LQTNRYNTARNMIHRVWWRAVRFVTFGALVWAATAGKKDPDAVTQVLALPKDPPAVATGETRRLVFHVSPLSAKGLLSQQTRDAMRAILKLNGGMPVIHIRAFAGGSGDLRRVPQIVSEVLNDKRMALPSVSLVQVGDLGLEGAQVVLEAVSVAKKDVNPDGIGFVSGPLAEVANSTGLIQVTCFAGAGGAVDLRSKFPGAAVVVVQALRAPVSNDTLCEGITRGGDVKAEKLAFTGTRVFLGSDEKAWMTAVQRVNRDLAEVGAEPGRVVATTVYQVSPGAPRASVFKGRITNARVEGVAALDGAFALDAVAEVKK